MSKSVLKKFEDVVYFLNVWAHRFAMIVLFFLMIITFLDVAGRTFFKPLYGTYELTELSLGIVILYGLGYTQIKKDHISIPIIVGKWTKMKQAIADLITKAVFFVLICITTWQLGLYAMRMYEMGERTSDIRIPVYILVTISTIGFLLFAFTYLVDLLKAVQKVVNKGES